ncbi:hypothetical protein A3C67_01540 [Candidatus Nomurabacteria bacterium RIFCSPHIGHO2_02_FULL_42_19]|uniref:LysM domain-containing protein n=1 Tax=Candidatus Nomurabacteria bacterium RIFCSPHIGHO2_02_FULL_42_19 TaxID=1801756 RepID=A0A1F6W290_9BACT|nr:MAG: hypothetical protein A3C67_01540 [Candidatus Nomurabacteria bacterium RIFCSPHIGHO2_02_FULL_42_19]
MTLLEANLSSALILGDETDEEIDENTNILSDNALLPATGPLGVSDGTEVAIRGAFSDQVSVYVVRKGDSISQIAEMFDVSVSTVLAANDLKKGDTIVEGEVLVILPISGIEHTVTKGQTLASIAKTYKVEISDITSYNGISEDAKLAIGDELLIPGGEMTEEGGEPSVNLGTSVVNDQNYYATHPIQGLASYFINPLPTGRKTQGLHGPGHRGIDIGAPSGTPIYAAASGIVLIAKTGWSGGYGNMTIIQHPNGTKTLYAHMSKLGTTTGASVSQGQVIGYVGSTGKSTGPHLHFEVFNAKNPGADWSWKN